MSLGAPPAKPVPWFCVARDGRRTWVIRQTWSVAKLAAAARLGCTADDITVCVHEWGEICFQQAYAQMNPIDQLAALLDRAGATVTFDSRRYARAAASWPDYLPPMFPREELKVEHWRQSSSPTHWAVRRDPWCTT